MKSKIAIVRGKFLNKYEMQFFEPLVNDYDITAFGSKTSFHHSFAFPTTQLVCPLDLPEFPYKWQLLNRVFTDAHYLVGLERKLCGFDLVHTAETYFRYTQQCLNAKKKGSVKKVVATVLENIPFNNEGIWGRKEYKERARKELDHIIALTERTKQTLLIEGADEKKITVLSHFVDTKRFTPRRTKETSDSLTLLFCGRLEIYKGVFEILCASAILLRDPTLKKYHLEFVFVGDGTKKKEMDEMEKRLHITQNVRHKSVGYDAMPDMFQNADIYLAPSKETETWQEQYNTTLLEAQSSGLPIVTTYSGGIPENVGDCALFANPGDVYSLVERVKDLITNSALRQKLGEKARERAVTVHDIHLGAKKLSDLYQYLLS